MGFVQAKYNYKYIVNANHMEYFTNARTIMFIILSQYKKYGLICLQKLNLIAKDEKCVYPYEFKSEEYEWLKNKNYVFKDSDDDDDDELSENDDVDMSDKNNKDKNEDMDIDKGDDYVDDFENNDQLDK